jgi:hypothetical protein
VPEERLDGCQNEEEARQLEKQGVRASHVPTPHT